MILCPTYWFTLSRAFNSLFCSTWRTFLTACVFSRPVLTNQLIQELNWLGPALLWPSGPRWIVERLNFWWMILIQKPLLVQNGFGEWWIVVGFWEWWCWGRGKIRWLCLCQMVLLWMSAPFTWMKVVWIVFMSHKIQIKITLELWPLHDGSINVLMWSWTKKHLKARQVSMNYKP